MYNPYQGPYGNQRPNQGSYANQGQNKGPYAEQRLNLGPYASQGQNQDPYGDQRSNQGLYANQRQNQEPYGDQRSNQGPYTNQRQIQEPYEDQRLNQGLYGANADHDARMGTSMFSQQTSYKPDQEPDRDRTMDLPGASQTTPRRDDLYCPFTSYSTPSPPPRASDSGSSSANSSLNWLLSLTPTASAESRPSSFPPSSSSSSFLGGGGEAQFHRRESTIPGLGDYSEPQNEPSPAKYDAESATSILRQFNLEKEDLEQLISYPENDITPANLPHILREIRDEKNRKAAATTSSSYNNPLTARPAFDSGSWDDSKNKSMNLGQKDLGNPMDYAKDISLPKQSPIVIDYTKDFPAIPSKVNLEKEKPSIMPSKVIEYGHTGKYITGAGTETGTMGAIARAIQGIMKVNTGYTREPFPSPATATTPTPPPKQNPQTVPSSQDKASSVTSFSSLFPSLFPTASSESSEKKPINQGPSAAKHFNLPKQDTDLRPQKSDKAKEIIVEAKPVPKVFPQSNKAANKSAVTFTEANKTPESKDNGNNPPLPQPLQAKTAPPFVSQFVPRNVFLPTSPPSHRIPTVSSNATGRPTIVPTPAPKQPLVQTVQTPKVTPNNRGNLVPLTPTPKIQAQTGPALRSAPKVHAQASPALRPTPKAHAQASPALRPAPKVHAQANPARIPGPKVHAQAGPALLPTPKVQPRANPAPVQTLKGVRPERGPTAAMIQDYTATTPRVFPHTCSLCNKECPHMKEWITHQNTNQHIEKCKILRQRFPALDDKVSYRRDRSHSRSSSPQRPHDSERRDKRRSRSHSPQRHSNRARSVSPLSSSRRPRSRSRSRERREERRGSSPRLGEERRHDDKRSSPKRKDERRASPRNDVRRSSPKRSEDKRSRSSPRRSRERHRHSPKRRSSSRSRSSSRYSPSRHSPSRGQDRRESRRSLSRSSRETRSTSDKRSVKKTSKTSATSSQKKKTASELEEATKKVLENSTVLKSLSSQADMDSLVESMMPLLMSRLAKEMGASTAPPTATKKRAVKKIVSTPARRTTSAALKPTAVKPSTMVRLGSILNLLSHDDVVAFAEHFGKTKSVLLFRQKHQAVVCFEKEEDAKKLRNATDLKIKDLPVTIVKYKEAISSTQRKSPVSAMKKPLKSAVKMNTTAGKTSALKSSPIKASTSKAAISKTPTGNTVKKTLSGKSPASKTSAKSTITKTVAKKTALGKSAVKSVQSNTIKKVPSVTKPVGNPVPKPSVSQTTTNMETPTATAISTVISTSLCHLARKPLLSSRSVQFSSLKTIVIQDDPMPSPKEVANVHKEASKQEMEVPDIGTEGIEISNETECEDCQPPKVLENTTKATGKVEAAKEEVKIVTQKKTSCIDEVGSSKNTEKELEKEPLKESEEEAKVIAEDKVPSQDSAGTITKSPKDDSKMTENKQQQDLKSVQEMPTKPEKNLAPKVDRQAKITPLKTEESMDQQSEQFSQKESPTTAKSIETIEKPEVGSVPEKAVVKLSEEPHKGGAVEEGNLKEKQAEEEAVKQEEEKMDVTTTDAEKQKPETAKKEDTVTPKSTVEKPESGSKPDSKPEPSKTVPAAPSPEPDLSQSPGLDPAQSLTVGETLDKLLTPENFKQSYLSLRTVFKPKFLSVDRKVVSITNLPEYDPADPYTEEELAHKLTPFGFIYQPENIYVIPQSKMALVSMPSSQNICDLMWSFVRLPYKFAMFRGAKLKPFVHNGNKPFTPKQVYSAVMKKCKFKCNIDSRLIFIKDISDGDIGELRKRLNNIGGVVNFFPLLNKAFVEFQSIPDADRLGVFYSLLNTPPSYEIIRVLVPPRSEWTPPPFEAAKAMPDVPDRAPGVTVPTATYGIPSGTQGPFYVTMSSRPFIYPTTSPWFLIPGSNPMQKRETSNELFRMKNQCHVLLTSLPAEGYTHEDVVRLVWPFLQNKSIHMLYYNVIVLPLQRRAFVSFYKGNCPLFAEKIYHSELWLKESYIHPHYVSTRLFPLLSEEDMYTTFMRLSNNREPEKKQLQDRLLCVFVTQVCIRLISLVMEVVTSAAPVLGFLPLANRICIEMVEVADVAKVKEKFSSYKPDVEWKQQLWKNVLPLETAAEVNERMKKWGKAVVNLNDPLVPTAPESSQSQEETETKPAESKVEGVEIEAPAATEEKTETDHATADSGQTQKPETLSSAPPVEQDSEPPQLNTETTKVETAANPKNKQNKLQSSDSEQDDRKSQTSEDSAHHVFSREFPFEDLSDFVMIDEISDEGTVQGSSSHRSSSSSSRRSSDSRRDKSSSSSDRHRSSSRSSKETTKSLSSITSSSRTGKDGFKSPASSTSSSPRKPSETNHLKHHSNSSSSSSRSSSSHSRSSEKSDKDKGKETELAKSDHKRQEEDKPVRSKRSKTESESYKVLDSFEEMAKSGHKGQEKGCSKAQEKVTRSTRSKPEAEKFKVLDSVGEATKNDHLGRDNIKDTKTANSSPKGQEKSSSKTQDKEVTSRQSRIKAESFKVLDSVDETTAFDNADKSKVKEIEVAKSNNKGQEKSSPKTPEKHAKSMESKIEAESFQVLDSVDETTDSEPSWTIRVKNEAAVLSPTGQDKHSTKGQDKATKSKQCKIEVESIQVVDSVDETTKAEEEADLDQSFQVLDSVTEEQPTEKPTDEKISEEGSEHKSDIVTETYDSPKPETKSKRKREEDITETQEVCSKTAKTEEQECTEQETFEILDSIEDQAVTEEMQKVETTSARKTRSGRLTRGEEEEQTTKKSETKAKQKQILSKMEEMVEFKVVDSVEEEPAKEDTSTRRRSNRGKKEDRFEVLDSVGDSSSVKELSTKSTREKRSRSVKTDSSLNEKTLKDDQRHRQRVSNEKAESRPTSKHNKEIPTGIEQEAFEILDSVEEETPSISETSKVKMSKKDPLKSDSSFDEKSSEYDSRPKTRKSQERSERKEVAVEKEILTHLEPETFEILDSIEEETTTVLQNLSTDGTSKRETTPSRSGETPASESEEATAEGSEEMYTVVDAVEEVQTKSSRHTRSSQKDHVSDLSPKKSTVTRHGRMAARETKKEDVSTKYLPKVEVGEATEEEFEILDSVEDEQTTPFKTRKDRKRQQMQKSASKSKERVQMQVKEEATNILEFEQEKQDSRTVSIKISEESLPKTVKEKDNEPVYEVLDSLEESQIQDELLPSAEETPETLVEVAQGDKEAIKEEEPTPSKARRGRPRKQPQKTPSKSDKSAKVKYAAKAQEDLHHQSLSVEISDENLLKTVEEKDNEPMYEVLDSLEEDQIQDELLPSVEETPETNKGNKTNQVHQIDEAVENPSVNISDIEKYLTEVRNGQIEEKSSEVQKEMLESQEDGVDKAIVEQESSDNLAEAAKQTETEDTDQCGILNNEASKETEHLAAKTERKSTPKTRSSRSEKVHLDDEISPKPRTSRMGENKNESELELSKTAEIKESKSRGSDILKLDEVSDEELEVLDEEITSKEQQQPSQVATKRNTVEDEEVSIKDDFQVTDSDTKSEIPNKTEELDAKQESEANLGGSSEKGKDEKVLNVQDFAVYKGDVQVETVEKTKGNREKVHLNLDEVSDGEDFTDFDEEGLVVLDEFIEDEEEEEEEGEKLRAEGEELSRQKEGLSKEEEQCRTEEELGREGEEQEKDVLELHPLLQDDQSEPSKAANSETPDEGDKEDPKTSKPVKRTYEETSAELQNLVAVEEVGEEEEALKTQGRSRRKKGRKTPVRKSVRSRNTSQNIQEEGEEREEREEIEEKEEREEKAEREEKEESQTEPVEEALPSLYADPEQRREDSVPSVGLKEDVVTELIPLLQDDQSEPSKPESEAAAVEEKEEAETSRAVKRKRQESPDELQDLVTLDEVGEEEEEESVKSPFQKKGRKTPVRKSVRGSNTSQNEEEEEEEEEQEEEAADPEQRREASSQLRSQTQTHRERAERGTELSVELGEETHLRVSHKRKSELQGPEWKRSRSQSPSVSSDTKLPPFRANNPLGQEFVVPKSGFFCDLCSVFYLTEATAREQHCSSRRHYDNVKKYFERQSRGASQR